MDRVVGPLEQPELAVLRQLEARVPVVLAGEADQPARGDHDRGGDVVLHLHLVGRDEVLPQLVGPPRVCQSSQYLAIYVLFVLCCPLNVPELRFLYVQSLIVFSLDT